MTHIQKDTTKQDLLFFTKKNQKQAEQLSTLYKMFNSKKRFNLYYKSKKTYKRSKH